MKKWVFKSTGLAGFILVTTLSASGQHEISKEFHKTFDANASTRLLLDNKYGNIDIMDWDRPQVKIDVVITVEHSNLEKAQKLLDYIDVIFEAGGNEIKAVTNIDSRFSRSANWGNENDFQINYNVQMPRQINLDLKNKYGNVFISELEGEAIIDVKYGKLTANRLNHGNEKPLHTVNLAYSSGSSISECDWLRANIKYSKLNIDKATALLVYSSYSKLFVDRASSVVIEGKYDGYEFGVLSNLVITTAYSGIKVDELNSELELLAKYTDVRIESVPAEFESIDVNSKYGTIRIGIDENASYRLDGEAGYSRIHYPESGSVNKIQENNSMQASGIVGTDPDPEAAVKISTKYGTVRLD